MTRLKFDRRGFLLNAVLPALVALSGATGNARADDDDYNTGRVFTATNAVAGNEITIYNRAANGSLSAAARVARDGSLTLLGDGLTAVIGAGTGPIDAALSKSSQFLYVLNGSIGTVNGYRVEANGSLTPINNVGGLAPGANGLVAN